MSLLGKHLRRASPEREPAAAANMAAAVNAAGWGLAFWGGVQLSAAVLEHRPMASALVQAALAEWGAGWIGIAWSDPLAPAAEWSTIGRRAARGTAFGFAAAVAMVLSALVTRAATIAPIAPSVGLLGVGVFASTLGAVRDELLLRGVALRVTRRLLPPWACLLVCGAAAAAARFGIDGAPAAALAAEGLRGVALGALWVRDRGAWMACAANASWTWSVGAVARGGLVDVRFAHEPDGGAAAVAVLGAIAAVAWLSIRRRHA